MMTSERVLGAQALDYIRERLEEGETMGWHLSRLVLDRFGNHKGVITTYLPDHVDDEAALALGEGGKFYRDPATFRYTEGKDRQRYRWEPVPNLDDQLAAHISQFLAATPSPVCVFENGLAKPSDPWLSEADGVIVGDNVLHVLDLTNLPDDVLLAVQTVNVAWPRMLGILATHAAEEMPEHWSDLTEAELRGLVAGVREVIVGAYDMESYLLWTPKT